MSPIPLGILAAAGFRPTAGGSYELIQTYTVGAGGVASVAFDVSSLSSIYQHLQIRYVARTSGADGIASVLINYNGTTTNYRDHVLYGTNGVPVTSSNSASSFAYGGVLARTNTSTVFGSGVIDILDAFEAKNKVHRTLSGMFINSSSFLNFVSLQSGLWAQTTPITEIKLTGEGSNLQQGSRFSLYGLKAS